MNNITFIEVCKTDNIALAKEKYNEELKNSNMILNYFDAFENACINNHIEIIKWFVLINQRNVLIKV